MTRVQSFSEIHKRVLRGAYELPPPGTLGMAWRQWLLLGLSLICDSVYHLEAHSARWLHRVVSGKRRPYERH